MRGLADGRLHRQRSDGRTQAGIALIFTDDRIHGVEHRDVYDGYRPARPPRTELLSKNAILSRRRRSVVEPAGVNRDLVPTPDCVQAFPRPVPGAGVE